MRVKLLLESGRDRRYLEVEGDDTLIPCLALTPYPYKPGYGVTHIPTGRAVNDSPLTLRQALDLVDDLKVMDIPWNAVVDGDNSKRLRFSHRMSSGTAP